MQTIAAVWKRVCRSTMKMNLILPSGRRYFTRTHPLAKCLRSIHRIVGACIDTTDFKRTQEEALARQKLESLGVLAGGIAHDFNNLLGASSRKRNSPRWNWLGVRLPVKKST